jgi:hypothetical protein
MPSFHRWNIQRGGKVVYNGIDQGLYSLVSQGCATENWNGFHRDGRSSQSRFYLGFGDLFAAEILLHQGIIQLGKGFDQLCSIGQGLFLQLLGDRDLSEFGPQTVLIPYDPFQLDEID